jgi:hypothetical protein
MNALATTSTTTRSRSRSTKARREATPEQKAAAAERRTAIRGMMAKIKCLPIEKRVLLADTFGIRSAEEGRTFSASNQILIAWQCPAASIVGGFEQWRKIGRAVRKGSKAIAIWIPIGTGVDRDGNPAGSVTEETRFTLGSVFDISQTYDIALGDIDGPAALPAPAAPIMDESRLLEYGATREQLAAAIEPAPAPQEENTIAPAPSPRVTLQPVAAPESEERVVSMEVVSPRHQKGLRGYYIEVIYTGEHGRTARGAVTSSKAGTLPAALDRARQQVAAGSVSFSGGMIVTRFSLS